MNGDRKPEIVQQPPDDGHEPPTLATPVENPWIYADGWIMVLGLGIDICDTSLNNSPKLLDEWGIRMLRWCLKTIKRLIEDYA